MKVHHIPEEKRFGLLDSTGTAWGELDYTIRGTVLSITHTGVSNEKEASALAICSWKMQLNSLKKKTIKSIQSVPSLLDTLKSTQSMLIWSFKTAKQQRRNFYERTTKSKLA